MSKNRKNEKRQSQGQGRNTKESEAGNTAIYAARGRSKETAEPLARVNESEMDEEPREETRRDYTLTKKVHKGRLENTERREDSCTCWTPWSVFQDGSGG